MVVVQRVLGMGFFDPGAAAVWNEVPAEQLWSGRRQPDPLPASVLVLLAPGGVRLRLCLAWASSASCCRSSPRKPLFGYKWVAMSSMAIALVGFLVWAHHMFVSGMRHLPAGARS
jgi:cytochrome c oxidase subunit 1